MDLEIDYENIRKMDEYMKTFAVPDKKNEESIEAEVLPKTINSPEDLDEESSANTEVNKISMQ